MPKMKTRRAAKKRFRVTGGGKVRFQRAGVRHNLSKEAELAPALKPVVTRMLGRR